MKTQPNVSSEQLARLQSEDEQLRPLLETEKPDVREEWQQYIRSLTGVVSRQSKGFGKRGRDSLKETDPLYDEWQTAVAEYRAGCDQDGA